MSLNVKTGALWERKDEDEEEAEVGRSKIFLNRHVHRDFRVNELLRKDALEIEEKVKPNVTAAGAAEIVEEKEAEKQPEEETGKETLVLTDNRAKIMMEQEEAERKRKKEEQVCTKEEYAVAKYLRFNTPLHTGRMAGMTIKCFIASEAVNCLLDSKWAKGKANPDSEIVFTDRKSVVAFLNRFLQKGLFHRADKVERKKDKDKKKKKKELEEKEKEKDADKESATDDKQSKKDKRLKKLAEKEAEGVKKEEKKADKSKQRKFKLNMSEDQRFVDGNSIYVWIYDPIHPKTFIIGFFMLLGAAALCLFPLWPDWMRIGVYYVSLLGASFVGFMLFLIVLRVIIFSLVWVVTMGKHHFWIFPNLTEDVGVIDSFRPLIKHDVYPPPELAENEDKKIKDKEEEREEDSENEDKNDDDFEIVQSKSDEDNEDDKTAEESENN